MSYAIRNDGTGWRSVDSRDDVGQNEFYADQIPDLVQDNPIVLAKSLRAAAYTSEADPLFFKFQRGESTREDWLAKIEEIKARYPVPEAAQ